MTRIYEGWSNERLDNIIKENNIQIKRLTDVDGWNTKVAMKCLKCDNQWETIPHVIKQGSGCPKCAIIKRTGVKKKAKYTGNEVRDILAKYNLEMISEKYKNSYTQMHLKCIVCGKEFDRTLISILRGYNKCPHCKENV